MHREHLYTHSGASRYEPAPLRAKHASHAAPGMAERGRCCGPAAPAPAKPPPPAAPGAHAGLSTRPNLGAAAAVPVPGAASAAAAGGAGPRGVTGSPRQSGPPPASLPWNLAAAGTVTMLMSASTDEEATLALLALRLGPAAATGASVPCDGVCGPAPGKPLSALLPLGPRRTPSGTSAAAAGWVAARPAAAPASCSCCWCCLWSMHS